jgi:aconitate hydratase 2/2-methylisocitrate dehydratase
LLGSTPLVVLSAVLGRFPSIEEYKDSVVGITLTDFAPPTEEMTTKYSSDVDVTMVG